MKQAIVFIIFILGFSFAWAESTEVTPQKIQLSVTEKGFEPASLDVRAGVPIILEVTRKTDSTCATAIRVPSKKIKMDLPLNKTVNISLGKLDKGEIKFACGMDMVGGIIIVK